ncbi:MAG: hypothetical protein ACREAF_06535 [Nitrosopumilaceae archaeon]
MISQEINVNGKKFKLVLTDQSIMDARRLKVLYNAAYEDPESFEEVSSAISDTITHLSTTVDPPATDSDLDGVIQVIMRVVDEKIKETDEIKSKSADDNAKASKTRGRVSKAKKRSKK